MLSHKVGFQSPFKDSGGLSSSDRGNSFHDFGAKAKKRLDVGLQPLRVMSSQAVLDALGEQAKPHLGSSVE